MREPYFHTVKRDLGILTLIDAGHTPKEIAFLLSIRRGIVYYAMYRRKKFKMLYAEQLSKTIETPSVVIQKSTA